MSPSILFVDDEPLVLESIKKLGELFDSDWHFHFCSNGQECLNFLQETAVDIAVVDMEMPDYDGMRLLGHIRELYPAMTRIAMSGFGTYESAMQAANSAHQFMHKPIESERLSALLQRSISLRSLLAEAELQGLVSRIGTLPSLPSLYSELIREINSPEASIKKVGEIIGRDMTMSAKILQLVNSAFFGLPRRVSNTSQAVNLLGLQVIKALVLTIQIFQKFMGDQKAQHYANLLFDHSVNVASLARAIVNEETKDQRIIDDTFMAALVHDVGKLILRCHLAEEYIPLLERAASSSRPGYLEEEEALGSSHAEVGAYLLGLWGLPMDIAEAVAYSHKPVMCPNTDFSPLTVVHAADALVHELRPVPELTGEKELHMDYLDGVGLAESIERWRSLGESLEL